MYRYFLFPEARKNICSLLLLPLLVGADSLRNGSDPINNHSNHSNASPADTEIKTVNLIVFLVVSVSCLCIFTLSGLRARDARGLGCMPRL